MATLDNVTLTISLGLGSGPLVSSPSWTDVSAFSKGFTTERGRSSILDQFAAGTGTVLLENLDGRFDPINASSPYSPNLKIGTQIRIQVVHSAVTYTLFRGMVDAFPITYSNSGQYSELELPFTDWTPILAGFNLDGTTYTEQDTGARITEILDDVGYPAGLRSIADGVAMVAAGTLEDITAADHIAEVVAVEGGTFFIAADGTATFQNRVASSSLSSTATFGTGGGEIVYEDIQRSYDRNLLYNKAQALRPGGIVQSASDATSITNHGPITLPQINAPFQDDNAALNIAEWQVGRLKDTVNRITSLSMDPDVSASTYWPVAAGTELREGVTVKFSPPGGGTAINQLSSVEGVSHSVDDQEMWLTTFQVWPLSTFETQGYWILGTSALNTTARLA